MQAHAGSEAAVAAAIRGVGGSVDAPLELVNGFAARIPASAAGQLRAHPGVRAVTDDDEVRFAGNVYDESTVASSYAESAGAPAAWSTGNTGQGVGVAVIDTGISPMNDFQGRLVYGPDLSGEGSIADTYGHGTVMAGIVGGSGADSASNAGGAYAGVAPHSTLVSVKVAGRDGSADVSTMLQAMHWVSSYKDNFNIRVLNLSWGTHSTANPAVDPLNYAVQRLWRQGIVVVAAAGNSGPNSGTITKPGDDPVVITAGAYDDKGDAVTTNDTIPQWSSRGPTAQGVVKPDVIAPGRTLVATRSYGSFVEQDNPKSLVAPSYIKGSGTSQAAAVVSGVAALLVSAHPEWTPDQVKAALRGTANPILGAMPNTQGKGRVNLRSALSANPGPAQQQTSQSSGLGSIEASRGGLHVMSDCSQNGDWVEIRGEMDVYCNPWDGAQWTGNQWTGNQWTGTHWVGAQWTGNQWTGTHWVDAQWTGNQWTGTHWVGNQWTGNQWTGNQWTGTHWVGNQWTGNQWTGTHWVGNQWTGNQWTAAGYGDLDIGLLDGNLFLSAFWGARPKAGHHVNGETHEPAQRARADGAD